MKKDREGEKDVKTIESSQNTFDVDFRSQNLVEDKYMVLVFIHPTLLITINSTRKKELQGYQQTAAF